MKNNNEESFERLLLGFRDQSLTDQEITAFFDLLQLPENQVLLGEAIENDLENRLISGLSHERQSSDAYEALTRIMDRRDEQKRELPGVSWLKWAAAASIAILVGLTGAFLFLGHQTKKGIAEKTPGKFMQDVAAPSSSRAILTLANGQKIALDSAHSGALAMQGQTNVVKLKDGEIAYRNSGTNTGLQYNILTVPRGSKIAAITLSDGTTVWVNAGSSLKYPVAFTGTERNVEINGEAYFEVSKNPHMPFTVKFNTSSGEEGKIRVLGTHFNVNAYGEEATRKITLLEGAIQVSKGKETSVVKPGEQVRVSDRMELVNNADINGAVAWKNGRFLYNSVPLDQIMRQISRSYDLELVYEDTISYKYTLNILQNVPVSKLLKFIELSGGVHFVIDGKKIIISQ
ncbi:FecR family protein [Chitinophaga sp. 22321]|uniref:FecR domain-containing protein n=1 Tax=Chitinophaga hostae TaxID=2831022 RepID=A0ABS5IYY9_9BACT|nr:FecR family protein [Chitinophaga hostae]MBS0028181.1 FecR domain-containing protein [Chitinophaga hostae]